jgi:hypothetical protein
MLFRNPLKKINTKDNSGRQKEKIIKAIAKKTPIRFPNIIPMPRINMQMRRFSCFIFLIF